MKSEISEHRLLTEAAEWRLISLLFDCPKGQWFEEVRNLGEQVTDERLRRAAKAAQKEAGEGLFHSVFGPGGPAPGREVSYRGWVQPGYLLSEISGFYNAFAFKPVTDEVPDHVAIETAFIAYLRLKEAFALEAFAKDNAETTAEASKTFIDEHLSKYAEQMSKILTASGIEYLTLAGEALFSRVGSDKDKAKQRFLPVLEDDDDESEFECGLN